MNRSMPSNRLTIAFNVHVDRGSTIGSVDKEKCVKYCWNQLLNISLAKPNDPSHRSYWYRLFIEVQPR
ncbi:hypothetical protein L5515_003862 [Caenorhabditis briggsae]|uniref:Uncharacterized protein n=1 Tax=Caenorhabditis briggsae TaxID=6238 RepID=A0AAE9EIL7_CAEBR|nr:hypothetical protein L3Y34_001009 [Caenorhabditis briggsae]UMM22875.1 hypothetical protein L5515_003862 [Caenorhabditis briggsae]